MGIFSYAIPPTLMSDTTDICFSASCMRWKSPFIIPDNCGMNGITAVTCPMLSLLMLTVRSCSMVGSSLSLNTFTPVPSSAMRSTLASTLPSRPRNT